MLFLFLWIVVKQKLLLSFFFAEFQLFVSLYCVAVSSYCIAVRMIFPRFLVFLSLSFMSYPDSHMVADKELREFACDKGSDITAMGRGITVVYVLS